MLKVRPIEAFVLAFVFAYAIFPSYLGARIGGVLINSQRVMLIALLLVLVVEAAVNRRSIPHLLNSACRARVTILCVAIYAIFRFASSLDSEDVATSLNTALSDVLSMSAFLYIGIFVAREKRGLEKLAMVLVASAVVLCLIGVVEAVLQRNLIVSAFPGLEVSNDAYLQFALSDKIRGTYRVQSTFIHPLAFASFLVMMLPLAIFRVSMAKAAPARMLYLGISALIVANIFLTKSRAAEILSIGIVLLYWTRYGIGLMKDRRYAKHAIGIANLGLVCIALAVAVPAAQQLIAGKSQDERSSSAGRLIQLEKGGRAVVEHPILGVGPRMAGPYVGIYDGDDSSPPTVDNWYLTVAVESGIIALLSFIGSIASVIWRCAQLARARRTDIRAAALYWSAAIGIGAFSLYMGILSLYQDTFPYLFLIMGAVLPMSGISPRRSGTVMRGPAEPRGFLQR
ncbi:hypothetical protein C9I57_14135 [Trinickia symbiotica]|uniref:O-antigen ligase-related domain-containing protein n=1 Tax=Trinickia symbiotica TaxID=863227 RepID=A0A2T3XUP7_9BURK|nr:O-antigen ligase family protein [Trinickia symbiotica]PTB20215.1 hypothetical protein C9I57_14135 [Trinickia symbiotica]